MIITALDTGMRRGEMLALRFTDIDWKRQLIVLRGETAKSLKTRSVPVVTARLRAVLEWLRLDADDQTKPDEALVFSDQAGEPVGRFRTAWVTAVLKAHGIKPEWKAYGWTALTPEYGEQFRRIGLRWHDLRHEYASRLVEKGVPLARTFRPQPTDSRLAKTSIQVRRKAPLPTNRQVFVKSWPISHPRRRQLSDRTQEISYRMMRT
jgi:integrase